MPKVIHQLRQMGCEIDDQQAREAWIASIELLESLGLTTKRALRSALLHGGTTSISLACWALGQLRDENVLDELLQILRRGDRFAFEAAKAIRLIASSAAIGPLIEVLTSGASVSARTASTYALAVFRCAAVEQHLSEILNNRSELAEIRAACAEALGDGHFDGAFDVLALSTTDASPDVRFWSVYALGELDFPAALEVVAARLKDHVYTSAGESISAEAATVYEMLSRKLAKEP